MLLCCLFGYNIFTFLCVCCSHCLGDVFEKGQCRRSGQILFKHCYISTIKGPSRTSGAVIVGSSGVCILTPKPISAFLSSVGGTNVILGLIAMATTRECLYALVKPWCAQLVGKVLV